MKMTSERQRDLVLGMRSFTYYELGLFAGSGNWHALLLAGLLLVGSIYVQFKAEITDEK